jgi:large subunit ribosomal protein L24
MKLKIRSGATVQVTAGAEKGKKGKVIEVDSRSLRIKVEGVKVMTHFDRKEGVKKIEGFIDYSNVKLVEAAPTKGKKGGKSKSTRATA